MSATAPEATHPPETQPKIPEGIVTPTTVRLFGKIPEQTTTPPVIEVAAETIGEAGKAPTQSGNSGKTASAPKATKTPKARKGTPVGKIPKPKKKAPAKVSTAKAEKPVPTAAPAKKPATKKPAKPAPALIVVGKPTLEQNIEQSAQRFEQILSQHQHPEVKAGWMPKEWTGTVELAGIVRTLRPGTATFTKANKVSIDCGNASQTALLKEILASTDPKQPGKPTTSAAGFLKHFRHIARAACRGTNASDAFAKLVKVGEICAAYLELLEQKHQPDTNNVGKTLDIQVLATKAEIIRQNHAGDGGETENMLSLIPTNLDHPVQMVMMPDPSGTQVKMILFQPQISLNYTEQETPIEKTLKNANWRSTILWIGVGLLIQAALALGLFAYKVFTHS